MQAAHSGGPSNNMKTKNRRRCADGVSLNERTDIMKRLTTLAVLCAFGSAASAWGISNISATTMHDTGVLTTEDDDIGDVPVDQAAGLCIKNFSKDDCDGFIEPGHYNIIGCADQECRTIKVTGAKYYATLKSSGLACGLSCESKCDEFPDGRLTLKFDYVLRADSCCPYRGSWEGEWEYVTFSGRTYIGTAHGTIGVGTNRRSECNTTGDECERCYDVVQEGNVWLVGIEGSFRGKSLFSTSPQADELNFTSDGTWIVNADADRPFSDAFRVRNRFDGSFLNYCP